MDTDTFDEDGLEALLNSNDPPSAIDIPLIEETISSLDTSYQILQAKLVKIMRQKSRYKSLLSGIRNLPTEILSEIFALCVEDALPSFQAGCEYSSYPNSWDPPYVLSQVCRRWRQVALSLPKLWRCVAITHDSPNSQTTCARMAKQCLELSRFSPLYITLGISEQYPALNESDELKVVEGAVGTLGELMGEISRWRFFEFNVTRYHKMIPASPFPPIPSTGAPNLRTACYCCTWYEEEASLAAVSIWILDLLRVSPNLQELSLAAWAPSLEGISWAHLQTFKANIGLQDVFSILMNCPALRSCDVEMRGDPFISPSENQIVSASLNTLSLAGLREEEVIMVLQWLTLPALKKLALEGINDDVDEWPDSFFTGFLARSNCMLDALSLIDLPFTEDQLIDHLLHISVRDTIENLNIRQRERTLGTNVLELLTFKMPSSTSDPMDPSPKPLFPKLAGITLTVDAVTKAIPLKRLVASRWYNRAANDVPLPVASLKQIYLRLVVPRFPNVELTITSIRQMFGRVRAAANVTLLQITVDLSGPNGFAGIEDLHELGFFQREI